MLQLKLKLNKKIAALLAFENARLNALKEQTNNTLREEPVPKLSQCK